MMAAAAPLPPVRPLAGSLVYRQGMACSGCWSTVWLIGRRSAECARCGLPVALSSNQGTKS